MFFTTTLSAQTPLSLTEKGRSQPNYLHVTPQSNKGGLTAKVEYISDATNGKMAWRNIYNIENQPFVFENELQLLEYMHQQGWELIQLECPEVFIDNSGKIERFDPKRYVFKKIGK